MHQSNTPIAYVRIAGDPSAIDDLETEIARADIEDLRIGEEDPNDTRQHATEVIEIVVAACSPLALKVIRDITIAYLSTRRIAVTVTDKNGDIVTSLEGPADKGEEMTKIVESLSDGHTSGQE